MPLPDGFTCEVTRVTTLRSSESGPMKSFGWPTRAAAAALAAWAYIITDNSLEVEPVVVSMGIHGRQHGRQHGHTWSSAWSSAWAYIIVGCMPSDVDASTDVCPQTDDHWCTNAIDYNITANTTSWRSLELDVDDARRDAIRTEFAWSWHAVCHTGLEPRTSRPQTGLPLTRASLALDSTSATPGRETS